jgi:hypothetical protein
MLPYPVILAITIVSLIVVSLVAYLVTESIFSILVILMIAGLIFYLLNFFGVLQFQVKDNQLDINFMEKAPAPHATVTAIPKVLDTREVFHISGDKYSYDEAPAVCAAYDAELATYDQIQDAYSNGAEWCEYGWSQGGMALFPTQEATWNAIQGEPNRTVCGRPGINGGYMDPKLKFGVNCYGVKPGNKSHIHLPQPVPGSSATTKGFNEMVNKFKNAIGKMGLSPFNRTTWSETTTLKNAKADIASASQQIQSEASGLAAEAEMEWGKLQAQL